MNLSTFWYNAAALWPEVILSITICAVLLVDMIVPLARSRTLSGGVAIFGLLAALGVAGFNPGEMRYFEGLVVADNLSAVLKLICLGGTAFSIFIGMGSNEMTGQRFGEFASLALGVCLGACALASANNFIVFIVALETVSLCAYALAGFAKHSRRSAEASLKYVLYGSLVSGVMLFGLGYLYGLSGSLQISTAIPRLAYLAGTNEAGIAASLVILLIGAGVAFKIAAVPFQFWCPDVYQGAPTPVTAFLSVVSKAAGFAAVLRLMAPVISEAVGMNGFQVGIGLVALITMTFGNLAAIRQTDVKRLLAYSSIAHAGYLLMTLAVFTPDAVSAVLVYLFIYVFMNLAAFWVTVLIADRRGGTELRAFRGTAVGSPLAFIVIFIALVSLTGLPPTAGFVGKFALFKVVVGAGVATLGTSAGVFFIALAVAGVINSVVSLFYYMKIARVMAFEQDDTPLPLTAYERVYAVCLALPLLLLLNFGPLFSLVSNVFAPARWFIRS